MTLWMGAGGLPYNEDFMIPAILLLLLLLGALLEAPAGIQSCWCFSGCCGSRGRFELLIETGLLDCFGGRGGSSVDIGGLALFVLRKFDWFLDSPTLFLTSLISGSSKKVRSGGSVRVLCGTDFLFWKLNYGDFFLDWARSCARCYGLLVFLCNEVFKMVSTFWRALIGFFLPPSLTCFLLIRSLLTSLGLYIVGDLVSEVAFGKPELPDLRDISISAYKANYFLIDFDLDIRPFLNFFFPLPVKLLYVRLSCPKNKSLSSTVPSGLLLIGLM